MSHESSWAEAEKLRVEFESATGEEVAATYSPSGECVCSLLFRAQLSAYLLG